MSRFRDKHRKEHNEDQTLRTGTELHETLEQSYNTATRVKKIYSYEPQPPTWCEKTFYVRFADGQADLDCKVTAQHIHKWSKEVPANAVMEPIYKYRNTLSYSVHPERWAYGVTFTWLVQE